MRDDSTVDVDLEDFTSGLSSTDYRLVPNTTAGSEGIYKPDANGDIALTVKDLKTGTTETVTLSDVASATKLSSVDSKVGDTNYSSTNYIHNEDNLTTAASTLDSAIKATADKVDAGWTATDGSTNIAVNPTNNTLKFAGDNNISVTADKANSTINVKLDPTLEVESVTASGDVVVENANGTHSLEDIGERTAAITRVGKNTTVISDTLLINNIKNTDGSFVVDKDGNVAVGKKVVINADSGTITGLTNKDWNGDTDNESRAATEGQLKDIEARAYKGWTVSANGEAGKEVSSNGKVDFSNTDGNIVVNQNGTNLTFDLNDNVTLGTDDNQININGAPSDGEALVSIGSGANPKFMIGQNGEINANAKDTSFNFSSDGVAVNANGASTIIKGQSIIVGSDSNGEGGVIINDNGSGTITGLSNTEWEGTTTTPDRAATEGQLQQVAAASKTTLSDGKNTTVEIDDTNADGHVDYQVNLNDNVTLGKGDNQININGAPSDGEAALSIGNKFVVEQDGSLTAQTQTKDKDNHIISTSKIALGKTQASVGVGDNFINVNNTNVSIEGDQTRVDIGENGAEFRYGDSEDWGYTQIQGGQILTDKVIANDSMTIGDISTGKYINVDGTNREITGLSNTEWNGTTTTPDRAATEGQLQQVSTDVDAGWVATDGANKVNVNPDNNTLKFTGDDKNNITVTAATDEDTKENSIKVELSDNLNVANVNASGDVTTPSADGTKNYSLKNIGKNTEAIYGTKVNGEYVTTVTGTLAATTIQNTSGNFRVDENGNVRSGDVVISAMGDIRGLDNTTWNPDNIVANRAATEGQLQKATAASKTTLSDGINTTVTSKTDTTDGHVDYQVNLDDNVYLGGDNTPENSNIKLDGENGVIGVGSTIALDGKDGTAVIGGVNITTEADEVTGKPVSTVKVNGDVTTTNADGTEKYSLNKIGKNTEAIYGTKVNGEYVTTVTGTLAATTIQNTSAKFRVDESGNVAAGKVIINATGDISGLSNTTWDGTTNNPSRAATEGQLKAVSDDVNAGWIATDNSGKEIKVNPDNNKLNFAGDNKNITVTATTDEETKENSINVKLSDNLDVVNVKASNDVVTTNADGTEKYSLNNIGKNTEAIYGTKVNGEYVTTVTGTLAATTIQNTSAKFRVDESGNVAAGKVIINATGDISGLSNTTWNGTTNNPSRAATEGQLKAVSDDVNAGWIATDNSGKEVAVNPDNNKLNFAGDDNITVTATTDENNNNAINVKLNDNITLGDGQSAITLNGSPQNSDDPALSVGTDKFVVAQDGSLSVSDKFNVDAETGNIYAANNSGSAIMMNDDSVALNAGGNGVVASDEGILLNTNGFDEDIKLVTKGTTVSVDKDGTTFTNVNTNETTNIDGGTINVGDRLMVEDDGSIYATNNNGSTVMINDNGVALNSEGNGVVVSGEGITLNANGSAVTVDRFNGTTFTNTNTGETTNINGGTITTDTVKGLSNTTWDDELATQVANSEELQGTAATQGQLQKVQEALNDTTEIANAGWNAQAGGNTINVKPDQTLNFEGDGNITVSATSGTSSELKFGLNHNIVLDNVKDENTMLVINTDGREGYVPDNYKDDEGHVNDFIDEHGGFAIYYANPSISTGDMTGTFGVTTDGVVHAKDVVSYYSASSGSQNDVIRYSLNDVGDIVTQIAHATFTESQGNGYTNMEYTLISDFANEEDKNTPFEAVDGKTRTIGLAVRQDGAVIVGAVVNDQGISSDRGIRINAESDGNGDNLATITGLENTTWTPPAPIATFANDVTETSRAATEAQLNDLYNTVAAYDVNADGTVDYNHITLAGDAYSYGLSRSADGTPTGGTSITNVAYASGNDGSEAVNVDYLNNAIKDAVKDGPVASNEKHLDTSKTYTPDKTTGTITINEVDGTGAVTGNQLVINDVASKAELDSLKTGVGDRNYNNVTDTTPIANGDSVTTAIGKLNNSIKGVTQDVINNSISGGHVDETGKVVLEKGEGENKSEVTTDIQLTDSEVSGVTLEKDTETGKNVLTITSTDKYDKNKTSSVTVSGLEIASTDDIKDVTGVASSEDLKDAYKDADKDGNATTEFITDSETMVDADVALDHAIQDVANTSYYNDTVLNNRINSLESRLGDVEERIDKVGAMAAAIANLRTMGFDPEAPTEIAVGVGQYKSETGIAIGVFHYPNQDFMLSASLSTSGDEVMGGIGATWRLGRKSAAERAKDEEAKHLEKAEEMKKLAQQEKVKAQAQRHAKLLEERQHASQQNA